MSTWIYSNFAPNGMAGMISTEIVVKNKTGIHARPAVVIVEVASKFESEIFFTKDDERANAKSIMGLLLLAAEPGSTILVEIEGPDQEQALRAIENLFASDFHHEAD